MHVRRLRTWAMAFAFGAFGLFGSTGRAVADILVTIDGTQTFMDTANNTGPFTFSFTAGSYNGSVDVTTTNYPGDQPAEITTTIIVSSVTGSAPENLTVQVQVVDHATDTNNLLWSIPSSSPIVVGASSSLSASGDSGSVTTQTYFSSTTSTTTTGLTGSPVTGTLADGAGGTHTSVANPSGTYTLSQLVTLSGLTIPSGGTKSPTFGGTSTVGAVPEPSSMALAVLGGLSLIGYGLRRRKAMGA